MEVPSLRIIGKGNKERLVPLPQPMLEAFEQVWRTHHNRRWLFPNHRGDAPLAERVLRRSFAAAATRHSLSASCAGASPPRCRLASPRTACGTPMPPG
jgi:integrase